MKNIITIFKKEFYRVISDRRLVFTVILLPGLAIFLMYSFMGDAISSQVEDIEEHEMIVYTDNMPYSFQLHVYTSGINIVFHELDELSFEVVKDEILEGNIDLLIIFPEDFENMIINYETENSPELLTYYNYGEQYSSYTYNTFIVLLKIYEDDIVSERFEDASYFNAFDLDLNNPDHNIVNEDKASRAGLAAFLPMMIIMFLFSGAMSIGPDSIAGEKERGTISTLLVTPIKRSEIATGKILSLSTIALLSSTSSFIGIILSLPKLLSADGDGLSISFGIMEYVSLFVIIIATTLFIVGMISVISAYAKTIKEASMMIMPFYFASIVIAISTMFTSEASSVQFIYVIPMYNSINMIVSILIGEVSSTFFAITVISNLAYVGIFIYILTRLFQSEKVMFTK
ncbi:MAG: ABC transporter permease subunit [Candidatus Izemoplasma sp.]